MAKANRSRAARKTPKHVTTLIGMHKQLRVGMGNVHTGHPVFQHVFDIGREIERALYTAGVNPNGERVQKTKHFGLPKDPLKVAEDPAWAFGGYRNENEEQRDRTKRNLKEALVRLQDAADLGEKLFTGFDSGLDSAAAGNLIRSTIDYAGREIEGMFPAFGLELKKDERVFLAE